MYVESSINLVGKTLIWEPETLVEAQVLLTVESWANNISKPVFLIFKLFVTIIPFSEELYCVNWGEPPKTGIYL